MTPTTHYDAIVIGAGQAGGPLSTALARAGWKTALIERVHVGGTCINEGCTPTKTMVASGRVAYLARRGADYGVQTGPVSVDMTKVRQRKRDIVESFRASGQRRARTWQMSCQTAPLGLVTTAIVVGRGGSGRFRARSNSPSAARRALSSSKRSARSPWPAGCRLST